MWLSPFKDCIILVTLRRISVSLVKLLVNICCQILALSNESVTKPLIAAWMGY